MSPCDNILDMDIKYFKLEELKPYGRNPRKNDHAVCKMVAALENFGFRVPILAKSDGSIIDGHLRVKAAKKAAIADIPAILCDDLSADQIRCLRLSVNKMAGIPQWDSALLNEEVRDLINAGLDLSLTSFDEAELKGVLLEYSDEDERSLTLCEKIPERGVHDGEVIKLGKHTVMCGDSTDEANYISVLQGEKVDLVFIDPPYNANYTSRGEDQSNKWGKIANDNLSDEEYSGFLKKSFSLVKGCMSPHASIYCCIDYKNYPILQRYFSAHFDHKSTIIWNKESFGMGKKYRTQYEMLLFGCIKGASPAWFGGNCESDVWNFKRESTNKYLHPTQKPVSMIKRAIINSSKRDDAVLDVFGGSGSTLLACEELDRRAFIIEKETKYIDVICERFKRLYG